MIIDLLNKFSDIIQLVQHLMAYYLCLYLFVIMSKKISKPDNFRKGIRKLRGQNTSLLHVFCKGQVLL